MELSLLFLLFAFTSRNMVSKIPHDNILLTLLTFLGPTPTHIHMIVKLLERPFLITETAKSGHHEALLLMSFNFNLFKFFFTI